MVIDRRPVREDGPGPPDRACDVPTADAAPRAPSSAPLTPMLATPGSREDLAADADWSFEPRWGGVRALAAITREDVRATRAARRERG